MPLSPPPAPGEPPFRWLFLDFNAYFASCEQQDIPALRGKPIAVTPTLVDSGCCIAASYPAKRFGIKTGMRVSEARQKCPEIVIVQARPPLYVRYHEEILKAVETVTPISVVKSIDEMSIRLSPSERVPEVAIALAHALKAVIREKIGVAITCSIGLSSNDFLAKFATDMQKPDGLTLLPATDVPGRLLKFPLTDFPGISTAMQARLNQRGIFSVQDMYDASVELLHAAWGSVLGDRWYYLIRGYEVPEKETRRSSVGHSHVMPPIFRTPAGAREILIRLLQKASARMREMGYRAQCMSIFVQAYNRSWECHRKFDAASDPLTLMEVFRRLWNERRFTGNPVRVGVNLFELIPDKRVTPSLFTEPNERHTLGLAVDKINNRYGKNAVYVAAGHGAKNAHEEKIAFTKTGLFREGGLVDAEMQLRAQEWRERVLRKRRIG